MQVDGVRFKSWEQEGREGGSGFIDLSSLKDMNFGDVDCPLQRRSFVERHYGLAGIKCTVKSFFG